MSDPPGVVTTTSIAPAVPAGVVTSMVVPVLPVIVAALPSKVTDVAPVMLVPVIVTDCPPALGPEVGLMLVITGAWADRPPAAKRNRIANNSLEQVSVRMVSPPPAKAL